MRAAGKARYDGTTADGSGVQLRLSSDGTEVAAVRIHHRVTRDDGESHATFTDIFGLSLHSNGDFSGHGTYTGSDDGSTNTISRSRVEGTFSLTATGTLSSGTTVHCSTGTVT